MSMSMSMNPSVSFSRSWMAAILLVGFIPIVGTTLGIETPPLAMIVAATGTGTGYE